MVHGAKKRFLVIEDEINWQELLRELLEDTASALGCTVEIVVANTYEKAIVYITTMSFDCFTLDNRLQSGGMALALLDHIARRDQKAPVVIVSGAVNPSDVSDFFRNYGIAEFFWKRNFDPKKFKQSITRLLEPTGASHLEVNVRSLDSVLLRFFAEAGFAINEVPEEREYILTPQDAYDRRRLGTRVYVRMEPERVAHREDIEALVDTIRTHYGNQLIDRTAFIVLERPPDYGARHQMQAYRFSDHFTMVPFSAPKLRQAVQEDSCSTVLQEVLSDYLGGEDLYESHSPVSDVLSFFGRERIVDTIRRDLDSGNHVALLGLRKMGKTSLLNYLRDQAPFPVAVLSLQDVHAPAEIYRAAIEEWRNSILTRLPGILLPDLLLMRPDFHSAAEIAFRSDLQTLLGLLGASKVLPRLVLCLDEIDEILPADGSSGASASAFRALMGFLRGVGTRFRALNLVVCGVNPDVNRINHWENQSNPVFQSFRELFLGPFTREESDEMIKGIGAHMGVEYDADALESLYLEASGHPYITRQICSLATRKVASRPYCVRDGDITAAVWEYLRNPATTAYLEKELWGNLHNRSEAAILKALAIRQPQTEGELVSDPFGNPEGFVRQRALEGLCERWLLKRGPSGYTIPYGCFHSWIRMTHLGNK